MQAGYRHVDSAAFYENEKEVGQAIRESGLKREEIFVTTKLWIDGHGAAEATRHFKRSLANLGLDYIDLYLIHSPGGGKVLETYDALLALQRQGLVRDVGVSNFGVKVRCAPINPPSPAQLSASAHAHAGRTAGPAAPTRCPP